MAPALRGVRDVDDPALPGARDYVLVNWAVVSFPGVGGLFPHRPAGGHAATVGGFRRGDVVVLTDPRGGGAGGGGGGGGWADWWSTARGERLVKRLVGLPSDLVVSTEGRYGGGEGVLTQVPDGYCWVEGDVRTAGARGGGGVSVDSHVFGPVRRVRGDGVDLRSTEGDGERGAPRQERGLREGRVLCRRVVCDVRACSGLPCGPRAY